MPFSGISDGRSVEPVGGTPDGAPLRVSARHSIITPGCFDAIALLVLRGPEFTDAEVMSDESPGIVIIDEPHAACFWPEDDTLGRYVRFYNRSTDERGKLMQVVWIVPGLRQEVFDQVPVPHVYVPFGDPYCAGMTIHLKTRTVGSDAEAALIRSVREEIRAFDAQIPVFALKTLEDHRDSSIKL